MAEYCSLKKNIFFVHNVDNRYFGQINKLFDIFNRLVLNFAGSTISMNSMKHVIPLHSLYCSIHTKDESKRGTAFAFIFGVN